MAEIKTEVSLADIAEQIAEVVKQNRVNGTYTSLSAAIHKLDLMSSAVLSANAGKVDALVLVSKALPECKHECTSSGTEISDTVLIIGEAEDGSSGVGLGHFQDDGKWIHYGGDYDFMIVTKVIAWKQIPSQLAIHRALQSAPAQQAIDAGKV